MQLGRHCIFDIFNIQLGEHGRDVQLCSWVDIACLALSIFSLVNMVEACNCAAG